MKKFESKNAYVSAHPIKSGVVAVLLVLGFGVVSAYALGFNTPDKVFAQIAPTQLPTIVVTAPVTPIVIAPPPVIVPIVLVPTVPITQLPGITVTGTRPGFDDQFTPPTTTGGVAPNVVTTLPGITVTGSTNDDRSTATGPIVTSPFGPPCCTLPPVTTPPIILPPITTPPIISPPFAPITICTLTATPSSVLVGGSTTLTWTTQNATSFSIDQGIGAVTPITGGSRTAGPIVTTTTYTGTATGVSGTVHCTATVTVTTIPPVPVCTLVANPVAVQQGGSSTLTWTTQNATTFSIDQGIGGVTPVGTGTRSVTPATTTTYIGTAMGAGGTVHCSATITVTTGQPPTPPICTLVANPTATQTGGSSTLTWTTQNATTFSIDQGIGGVTPVTGGTRAVTPANTITYTGTATGPGGTVNCTATITVTTTTPGAQCVLTASPTSITPGGTSAITWSGTNIASVVIDQGIGARGATGSVNVNPTSDTTYTGTFTSTTGQTLTCSATVVVTTGGGGCTSNCGGGGHNHPSPRVVLSSLKSPGDQPLAFVYLSQIPYTGLDLGPIGTAMYWLMLILWSLAAAYLIFFNALPFAYKRVGVFGGNVKEVLRSTPSVPAHSSAVHTPVHAAPAVSHVVESHAVAPAPASERTDAPRHRSNEGFRSYASGAVLSIDDIVNGLAREAEARPTASAHSLRADFMEVPVAHVEETPAPVYVPAPVPAYEAPAPVAPAHLPFNEDLRHFIEALLHGDRETVFATVRGITRTGGDSEAFLTHAVCALDDAYRSRLDGSVCHPDILAVTADCHSSFLERIVTSLSTAVDGSYSTGITGVKLALTRALAVANG